MGALQGSISYKLFFVEGELPSGWKEAFFERINHRRFTELSPDEEDEERYGWVPIDAPLESSFNLANVLYNSYLNLGFRRDRFSIPTERFRAEVKKVSHEFMKQNEIQKLTRFQKEDITRMVRNDLKRRSIPTMKVVDMSWNLDSHEVRFWSQSAKLCELFQGYFEDTFGLKLLPAGPYISAINIGLEPEQAELLATIEPTNFVEGRVGIMPE